MQSFLDPRKVAQATEVWKPSEPLPQAVRKFGFVPDTGLWKSGDLLLFSALEPNWIAKEIIRTQAKGWNSDDAQWQHAAVYIGRSRVCEATIGGVGLGSIYKYIPTHLIRVRRIPNLDITDSHDLVVAALLRLNRWYSLSAVASVWWRSLSGFSRLEFAMAPSRTHICSHLYADAFTQATGQTLEPSYMPTPASLSASNKFVDVESRWQRLAV